MGNANDISISRSFLYFSASLQSPSCTSFQLNSQVSDLKNVNFQVRKNITCLGWIIQISQLSGKSYPNYLDPSIGKSLQDYLFAGRAFRIAAVSVKKLIEFVVILRFINFIKGNLALMLDRRGAARGQWMSPRTWHEAGHFSYVVSTPMFNLMSGCFQTSKTVPHFLPWIFILEKGRLGAAFLNGSTEISNQKFFGYLTKNGALGCCGFSLVSYVPQKPHVVSEKYTIFGTDAMNLSR